MRLFVFSDVHGNLPALELALKDAGTVDGYICLGDVVDYGPWSNECVDLINSLQNVTVVQGNHEHDFLSGTYPGDNPIVKAFFNFCLPSFERYETIAKYPPEYILDDITFRHTIENRNIYPDSEVKLNANYVVGHSHHQFMIKQEPYFLYNPGSIGQNRKYINLINYALFDTESRKFESRSLRYDEMLVINEMKNRGYPDICIAYYNDKERA